MTAKRIEIDTDNENSYRRVFAELTRQRRYRDGSTDYSLGLLVGRSYGLLAVGAISARTASQIKRIARALARRESRRRWGLKAKSIGGRF